MTTKNIIENYLGFLITEYNFLFEYNNTNGNHYIFKNKNGFFEYYEWQQFGESAFYVKYDLVSKKINLWEEYPKMVGLFNQTHKGIKWLFKDKREDYWDMISQILKNEIQNKNNIFGLKV